MRDVTPRIFVVDDEPSVRESLEWLFESVSLPVETFDSGRAFLDADVTHAYGCLVLDVRMQNLSGLQLQKILYEKRFPLPVIFLSAYGDAQMGAQAVKLGAIDFLQKPYRNQDLLDVVNSALELSRERLGMQVKKIKHIESLGKLSARENEILNLVVSGMSSKEIARSHGISPKTVDVHRAHLMNKLGVKSSKDLTAMAMFNNDRCSECRWFPSPANGSCRDDAHQDAHDCA